MGLFVHFGLQDLLNLICFRFYNIRGCWRPGVLLLIKIQLHFGVLGGVYDIWNLFSLQLLLRGLENFEGVGCDPRLHLVFVIQGAFDV